MYLLREGLNIKEKKTEQKMKLFLTPWWIIVFQDAASASAYVTLKKKRRRKVVIETRDNVLAFDVEWA